MPRKALLLGLELLLDDGEFLLPGLELDLVRCVLLAVFVALLNVLVVWGLILFA